MADFCKQCTEYYFDKELAEKNDMKGLISEQEVKQGFGAIVLCEGCGGTIVDHEGNCINMSCERHSDFAIARIKELGIEDLFE